MQHVAQRQLILMIQVDRALYNLGSWWIPIPICLSLCLIALGGVLLLGTLFPRALTVGVLWLSIHRQARRFQKAFRDVFGTNPKCVIVVLN